MASTIIKLFWIYVLGFVYVNGWSGNVCSRVKTTQIRERYCRYSTWRACCWWGYRWKTVYSTEYFCCSGWRERSRGVCTEAICYPTCQSGGTCVSPNVCDCVYPFEGQICTGVQCSHLKPCYPGVCDVKAFCTCDRGFGGTECTTITSSSEIPHIDKSTCLLRFYDRVKKMAIYEYATDATMLDEKDILWVNQDDFNELTFKLESVYMPPDDISARSPYVSESILGIVSAEVDIEHTKIPFNVGSPRTVANNDTLPCDASLGSPDNPNVGIYNCSITEEYVYSWESGDWLTVTFKTKNGGVRKMVNLNDVSTVVQTDYYIGKETTKTVEFRFDFTPPVHCAEDDTCDPTSAAVPLKVKKDITKEPITSWWEGWSDDLSGMFRYAWEIFKLQPDETGLLYEPHHPHNGPQPLVNRPKNHSDGNFEEHFTPNEAGMYSIVLEASDKANNSKYARRFVLYDPGSQITLNTGQNSRLHVTSAYSVGPGSDQWHTYEPNNQPTNISVSWSNHFANKVHEDGKLLNGVKGYPSFQFDMQMRGSKFISDALDDNEGERTINPILNAHGIIKFEVVYSIEDFDNVPTLGWVDVGINEQYHFERTVEGGDTLRIWVKAHDIMGNALIDHTTLHFDNDPSQVTGSPSLEKKANGTYPFTSRIVIEAFDLDSGISEFGFRFVTNDTNEDLHSETFAVESQSVTKEYCDDNPRKCYCTYVGCFDYEHEFEIDNCWLVLPKEKLTTAVVTLHIDVFNIARLKYSFSLQITDLLDLQGLGEYHGPMHVQVGSITESSAQVTWHQAPTCYERTGIKAVIGLVGGKKVDEFTSHKDAEKMNWNNLNEDTVYVLDLYTMYESEISDNVTVTFRTAAVEGLSGGAIAGIVISLLIVIILVILLFILWRTERLCFASRRDVEQGKRSVSIRKQISKKMAVFKRSNKGYDNNAYGNNIPLGINAGSDDELYIVRDELFEEHPSWLMSREEVTFESLITSGRFANIYKSTAYRGTKKQQTVVAKTLKENPTEDDLKLMKAKIGFYAEEVGNHPNILHFIGAVGDDSAVGPFMILEYCETGTLHDYLQKNKDNVTNDLQDRLFRFGFFTCKGMEYLASRKIVHRRLAARNILLTYLCDVKISGFGPKVHGDGEDGDDSSKKERIPIKWMAPEFIENNKCCSEKSDVWSFGIVLWEIFSLGETPFKGIKASDLLNRLKRGYKMEKPEQCDEFHYKLMKKCWSEKPNSRPNFSSLRGEIEPMFDVDNSEDYYFYKR